MLKRSNLRLIFFLPLLFLFVSPIPAQVEIEWARNYGGSSFEQARTIKQTIDEGYIVAGTSHFLQDIGKMLVENYGSNDLLGCKTEMQLETFALGK